MWKKVKFLRLCLMGLSVWNAWEAYHWKIGFSQRRILKKETDQVRERVKFLEQEWQFLKKNFSYFEKSNLANQNPILSRWAVGEGLKRLARQCDLQKMTFSLMPETRGPWEKDLPLCITPVSIIFQAKSDHHILTFIHNLPKFFSGLLRSRRFTLEGIFNKNISLNKVQGHYLFDWVIVGGS